MKKIILTSGDPAGIGPEICLKFLTHLGRIYLKEKEFSKKSIQNKLNIIDLLQKKKIQFILVGSVELFSNYIKTYQLPLILNKVQDSFRLIHREASFINVVFQDIAIEGDWQTGRVSYYSGKNALDILNYSTQLLKLKLADAVVTAPINKEAINNIDEKFLGHTEYYAREFNVKKVKMCFLSPVFDLVLMTTHISIDKVHEAIDESVFIDSLESAIHLQKLSGDDKPLLLLGIDPHAGENGKIGKKDLLVKKWLASYQKKKINLVGPLSADSAFVDVYAGKYRTVIANYHDQGLIPLKMLSKGQSVNVSLGLPFIRTSVDHGTAFNLVGKWRADCSSLFAAVESCLKLLKF